MHVLVNKEKAALWLHTNSYEGQRHIREQHVDYLAMLMRDGLFRKGTLISFAALSRRHYLINGYHTLQAIEKYNLEYELAIEDIEVADKTALAALYATFDRGLQRSHSDVLQQYGVSESFGITRSQVNAAGSALVLLTSDFTVAHLLAMTMKSGQKRYEALLQYRAGIEVYFSAQQGCTGFMKTALYRQPVVAVGIYTCQYQEVTGYTFWRAVTLDDGLTSNQPEKAVVKFLQNNPSLKRRNTLEYARVIVSGWNAAFEKRTLSKLYTRHTDIHIAGTPLE